MRRTRTRTKSETRNPRYKLAFSFSENEMMGLGLFASSSSSSSSSSSNLSPLALPFTVERSNNTKFNFSSNPDPHFNFNDKSDGAAFWSTSPNFQSSTATQGLLADSIRTATVPSTYSMFPNPISTPNTHNRSSVPAVNLSAIGPNQRATDTSFSSPFNAPNTHTWSSMNSSVKSGLEPVNPPAGQLYGMNPNSQPHKWSLSNDDSDNGASVMPLNFNLLPYGSSQASYTQCLSGSKYIGQGKENSHSQSHIFAHPVTRENNIGSSVIGKIHITSPSSTSHHELVSNGFSNEDTFTWNKCTPRYPFDNTSIFYNSSSDHIAPSITTKSLDVNNTSLFTNYNLSVPHDPLKEKESYHAVGFDYKSSLNSQVLDMNNTEEVTSAAQISEHLDHHNPGEDSPCWKGATSHFSSSGSQEHESSSHHPLNKPLKNSDEDALLHQSLHGTVETAANFVTSESLDVNTVVKGLNNLSDLLLQLYLKDECGLKEQDHKALAHVISNLNVCLSSKIQEVDHTQKFPLHKHNHITSNVLHEEKNSDQFGKNIEEPKSDFVSDEGLPKDYNMVQKIKRVLDENLECTEDLPSDPVLFKNLWLEAEAELCVSGYKARLHRAKRDMCKSKAQVPDVVSDIKKVSSTSYSPTAHELFHEVSGRKTSNTHTPNLSLPVVNDVENSVMARFNILKLREESNSVKEPADVEVSCSKVQSFGMVNESHFHLQHLLDTGDGVLMQDPVVNEDVDHAVMARLNVLKSRGELDRGNVEQGVLRDVFHAQVSEEVVGMQNQFGSLAASSFGWEYVTKG